MALTGSRCIEFQRPWACPNGLYARTIAAHNGLMQDLGQQRERRREKASRSNMAEAVFVETDQIYKQAERTWDHYVATQAPTAIRVKPSKRGA